MQIGEYYFSKRQTFILIILVLGMVFGLSLVQREQTLKTRAAMISNAFEVYENHYDEGKGAILADCRGQTCTTNTRQVLFKPQPQRTEPYKAEVATPVPIDGNIAQCWFYRSGDGPGTQKQIKSSNLISYINNATSLTGIPPVVLAAFIRVETGDTLDKNNSTLESFCPRGKGGDTGVMQIVKPGYPGHDRAAVDNGARLIGKTVDSLTDADYCDPRENIIIGSGFLLKKMTYFKRGDGTYWDPAWTYDYAAISDLVQGFNGGTRYTQGNLVYSYPDDIMTSIKNCK